MTVQEKKKHPGVSHVPTDALRQIASVLAGFSVEHKVIASCLQIDVKTMYKHYRDELDNGAAIVQGKLIGNLLRIASGSDGTALNAIKFALCARFGWSQYAPAPIAEKPEALGKKAQLVLEAHHAHKETSWGELLQ